MSRTKAIKRDNTLAWKGLATTVLAVFLVLIAL